MQTPSIPPSALVQRDLAPSLWPLWLALRPQLTHTGAELSLAPQPAYVARNEAAAERRAAAQVLAALAAPAQSDKTPPWQLTLGELAALLKQEQFAEAEPLLALLAQDPTFVASLAQPPTPRGRSLIGQHPLWLAAHVAVERGAPAAIITRFVEVGLRGRQDKEPAQGSLLLLNALRTGNKAALGALLGHGFRLEPAESEELFRAAARLPSEVSQLAANRTLEQSVLVERLEWLSEVAARLNLPVHTCHLLASAAQQVVGTAPRVRAMARRLTGSVAAAPQHEAAPPRRQTGVFWRRG